MGTSPVGWNCSPHHGLLPQDKMDRIRSFLHENFSREGENVKGATARAQLIIFGAFFLFIGLLLLGLIQL
jgi:hypothetical protein